MRIARPLSAALVAASLSLAGCPVAIRSPGAPPAFTKPATEPPSTPCTRTAFEADGTYVHPGTGVEFPETAAGWMRVAPSRYDREGNDVGIGYHRNVGDVQVEMTIYVFPRYWNSATEPMSLDEEFLGEADEIRSAFSGATDGPQSVGAAPFRGSVSAGRAIEMTAKDPRPFVSGRVVTRLTTYAFDPWRLKYRVTHPAGDGDAVRAAVDELLSALHLPPLVPPPGSPGGGADAK